MYMIGRGYALEVPAFARAVAADEAIIRLSAPANAILLIWSANFGIVGTDSLNEPNYMEWLRLTTDGAGGGAPVVSPLDDGDPAFGGTSACLDADDWTTDPTAGTIMAGAGGPFNLATGWQWSAAEHGKPLVVPAAGRIGFRLADTLSASMTCHAGVVFSEIGT